ncbi:hypothetical protein BJ992_002225 [Sphaerisporangium rubeum]|uniref:Uncharacterized protein n=1 Tax=Sphaerisporangium rubeum TaxID=321317 RepID=A0A7X0IE16_9ACTN|nr:hypothetical protein [Sphaerisporangium rubeum]
MSTTRIPRPVEVTAVTAAINLALPPATSITTP